MQKIETDSTKKDFAKYLDTLGVSPKSHKNYRSDLSHFVGWAILKIRSFGSYVENLTEVVPFLNDSLANDYKNYMVENKHPSQSINRRLSTLRHLSRFLVATQAINSDFTVGIENISLFKNTSKPAVAPKVEVKQNDIVDDFKAYLEAEKVSASTLKNYLSDVRQFVIWLEKNSGAQTINN